MSSSRVLCCFLSLKKQKHDFYFFRSTYNKIIIRSDFVISRIIKISLSNKVEVEVKGYQPRPSAPSDNLDLDYSDYHKNLIQ